MLRNLKAKAQTGLLVCLLGCAVKASEEEECPGRVAHSDHSQSPAAEKPTPLTGWASPTGFPWD